jgi:hypothetical protein
MVKNAGKKKVYHKQFMIISFTNRSIEVQIILTTSNKWINSTYKIYFLGINAFTTMPSKKCINPDYHCTIVIHFVSDRTITVQFVQKLNALNLSNHTIIAQFLYPKILLYKN